VQRYLKVKGRYFRINKKPRVIRCNSKISEYFGSDNELAGIENASHNTFPKPIFNIVLF
jgi:hypothetical protein